jgi:XTP/dITP diphosphohydrolase
MKIILATQNPGKVLEFNHLATTLDWELIPLSQYSKDSPAETGLTFIENAIIKARHASALSGLPALADDSGIVVDALHGAPGIYSARYAGENVSADLHIQKLLSELAHVPKSQRTAHFYCVLVFLRYAEDPAPLVAQGKWDGQILLEPRGRHGFGYDPIFYVPTHHCSAAELLPEVKNKISHRAQALLKLLEFFRL